ncbi:MAG TPA: hypothetical protein VJC07_04730 [Candidatus Nanoarchaeia archaeon]|nr:hypothetical protein [Candidatus Nanoarchaeia archaeon]
MITYDLEKRVGSENSYSPSATGMYMPSLEGSRRAGYTLSNSDESYSGKASNADSGSYATSLINMRTAEEKKLYSHVDGANGGCQCGMH